MSQLDDLKIEYREALANINAIEVRLAATRNDPAQQEARRVAIAEKDVALMRLRDVKDAVKAENTRRNFAGIDTPLHAAVVEKLSVDMVAELERRALELFGERERVNAERRAAKAATSAAAPSLPTVPARPPSPEVYLRRPSTNGSTP
jgi:uncharacterized small protein (DUF1192 family)